MVFNIGKTLDKEFNNWKERNMEKQKHTQGLSRKTKDQLVKIAYVERVSERQFITEHRGPMRKDVIVDAILSNRAAIAKAEGR